MTLRYERIKIHAAHELYFSRNTFFGSTRILVGAMYFPGLGAVSLDCGKWSHRVRTSQQANALR